MSKNIVIKLSLDNGNFSSTISSSKRDLDRFKKAVGAVDRSLERSEKATRGWGKALRDSIIVLGLSRHAILNLDAALLSIPRSIITASGELERMTQLMKGLSNETSNYQAIINRAQTDTKFVLDLSQASPFEITTMTDSFVKFRSVGLDPTNGSLQALTDSVAKFGGSKEQLKRASIAIQQMAGKGVISMEEMRQQLAESVPDAMKLMARGTGKSMSELTDLISKGAVASTGALNAMFRQMAIENSGAAEEMSQTWVGLVNRLETQMTIFKKRVGDAGYFEEVKEQLRVIVEDLLSSPEALSFAKNLGEGLASAVRGLSAFVKTIYEYKDLIVNIGIFTAAWVVRNKVLSLSLLTSGNSMHKMTNQAVLGIAKWRLFRNELDLVALRARRQNYINSTLAVSTRNVSVVAAQARFALAGFATGIRAVGASMLTLIGGPLGLFTAAVAVALPLMDEFGDKAKELVENINSANLELVTDKEHKALRSSIDLFYEMQGVIDNNSNKGNIFGWIAEDIASDKLESLKETFKEFGGLEGAIKLDGELAELRIKQSLDKISSKIRQSASNDLRAAVNRYKDEVDKVIESTDKDKDKQKETLDDNLQNVFRDYFEVRLQSQRDYREKLLSTGKGYDSKEYRQSLASTEALKSVYEDRLDQFGMEKGGIEESKTKAAAKNAKDFKKLLEKLEDKAASSEAALKGTNTQIAKFNAELKRGEWKFLTPEQKTQLTTLMTAIENNKDALKEAKNNAREYDQALQKISKTAVSIDNTFNKRTNKNKFLKDSMRAKDFVRQLEEISKTVAKSAPDVDSFADSLFRIAELEDSAKKGATESMTAQFSEAAQTIENDLLPSYQRIQGNHHRIIDSLKEWRGQKDLTLTAEQEETYLRYIKALNEKFAREMETPVMKLMRTWENMGENINNVWASAMDGFVDTLADGLVDGEFKMEQFFTSFMKMIVKAQLQGIAANLAMSVFGGGQVIPQTVPGMNSSAATHDSFANGGIMTSKGALELQKYANGGIANRPQVALYGEGSQPEAYVPLPDGRTIPVSIQGGMQGGVGDVQVNVINQTGEPVTAQQQGQPKFDGEQMVLDVVLKNVRRAGPFRDSMKGAMK